MFLEGHFQATLPCQKPILRKLEWGITNVQNGLNLMSQNGWTHFKNLAVNGVSSKVCLNILERYAPKD